MLSLARRKLRALARRPRFVRVWLIPICVLLGLGRVLVALLPFVRLASFLGRRSPLDTPAPPLDARQRRSAGLIRETLALGARYTPWQSHCFAQALAARALLALYRVPCAIYFGVARDAASAGLEAHCWVVAADLDICGGAGQHRFTRVGCFLGGGRRC